MFVCPKLTNFAHIMANPLKQLAGETAVYGLSTILARIINFLFVPFYTRMLTTSSYGVVTEFMAYIAVFQVVLVLGLETGCFRFANKEGVNPRAVYSNALVTVFGTCFTFLAFMILFSDQIASALGYQGFGNCIIYIGGILALDSTTAILFAKLRQEHKAFKFAIIKTVKILTETAANMVLFFWYPAHVDSFMSRFVSPTPDFTYVIFAILVSSVVCALMFLPDLLRFSFEFDRRLLKQMLAYFFGQDSVPLFRYECRGMALKLRNLSGSCKTFRNHEPLHPDVQIRRRTILLPEGAEQGFQTALCHRNGVFYSILRSHPSRCILVFGYFRIGYRKRFPRGNGRGPDHAALVYAPRHAVQCLHVV